MRVKDENIVRARDEVLRRRHADATFPLLSSADHCAWLNGFGGDELARLGVAEIDSSPRCWNKQPPPGRANHQGHRIGRAIGTRPVPRGHGMQTPAAVQLDLVGAPGIPGLLRPAFAHSQNRVVIQNKGHRAIGPKRDLLERFVVQRGHQHRQRFALHAHIHTACPCLDRLECRVEVAEADDRLGVFSIDQGGGIWKLGFGIERLDCDTNPGFARGADIELRAGDNADGQRR